MLQNEIIKSLNIVEVTHIIYKYFFQTFILLHVRVAWSAIVFIFYFSSSVCMYDVLFYFKLARLSAACVLLVDDSAILKISL